MIKFCEPLIPDMFLVESKLKASFQSGHLSNFGPAYKELAQYLTKYLHIEADKEIVLTSSGHTALMAACALAKHLGYGPAAIPTFTFESTRAAAVGTGLGKVDVEMTKSDGCLHIDDVCSLDDNSYGTVMAVCALSTIPITLQSMYNYCTRNGKFLIVDGAASFGTEDIIPYCDAYCLSFHATKSLSVGEGGAIVVKKEYADFVRSYINFGFDSNRNVIVTGINGKISDYACAVAHTLLETKFYASKSRRLDNYRIYHREIKELIPESMHSFNTVYQTLPMFFDKATEAAEAEAALLNLDIEVRKYYPPYGSEPTSLDLYDRNLCLPIHQGVSEKEVQLICDTINSL